MSVCEVPSLLGSSFRDGKSRVLRDVELDIPFNNGL